MSEYKRFEVIPSKVYRHKVTGRKVSPYGAVPWHSDRDRNDWAMVIQGWTFRDNHFNTIGNGHKPWKTREEAEQRVRHWNRDYEDRVK